MKKSTFSPRGPGISSHNLTPYYRVFESHTIRHLVAKTYYVAM